MPRSTVAGSFGKSMFSFVRNCQTVFQIAVPFCIPNSSGWEFLLLHILVSIWYWQALDFGHSDRYIFVTFWFGDFFLSFFFLINFIFIYFWLCWVFVAACGLSLVAASGGYSSMRCTGFSLRWLLLLRNTGSRRTSFSSCGSQALEHKLSSFGTRA